VRDAKSAAVESDWSVYRCGQTVNSEVSAGKSSLDDVIIVGGELKKHSSDAANTVQLDAELTATKQRYEALVRGCADRLARLEDAVPLTDTLHSMHDQLTAWLQHAEPELQSGKEPTGNEAEKQLDVSTGHLARPGGNVTSAGWQVTLCDPMWHVSSRSGVATL